MFLKNAWYVAAWDHEVTRELQQITVLGENICVYRTEAGELVGLEDACPHRKLPLSKGRIKGARLAPLHRIDGEAHAGRAGAAQRSRPPRQSWVG